ncbi:putative adenosine kinase [Trypanosoma cruzi]|uniref:Ribokinase n=2 Tax=Trypanosoma cruzi TaxID=5693 RepID=V5BXE5_TRYCR|nr:adenosine kinase [Trypanosoma cruzi Dm28c]PBJ79204.1 ribokinase [Trypanosoma cruzi cruzi]PWU96293.1 putative ribokinase [Trypanosoma cruzi]RNF18408.1 putative adenosine kinase [Trypanosoma cruzi]
MNRLHVLESHEGSNGPTVVVVGSCFLDYIAYVDRIPRIGETLTSRSFSKGFGGKGANQAVAAGRLGAHVAMVGIVGSDGDGEEYIANFKRNGVDTTNVYRECNGATGLAMIFVDTKTSNNEIVICPNATRALTTEFLRRQSDNYNRFLSQSCRFLICQNEIPLETTLDVLREAHKRGIYTVFNSAPAPSSAEVGVIKPFLPYVSLFCPNEVEAAMITGMEVSDGASAAKAAKALQALGVRNVVITLGAQGYIICEMGSEPIHAPGLRVKAVDTTGAGDSFVGSMVYYMSKGMSLSEACRRANVCAAFSVQRKGTQSSYPTPDELPADARA